MANRNAEQIYLDKPVCGVVNIETANTNRDGTGVIEDVCPGSERGTVVELVRVVAKGTTTAGIIRLFINDGGSEQFLLHEIVVSAITPSASVAVFTAEWTPSQPLRLPENFWLRASTHNAEDFVIYAFGGDY